MVPRLSRTDVKSCPKCGSVFPGEPMICTTCGIRLIRISYPQDYGGQAEDPAEYFFKEGISLSESGRYSDALDRFDRAITINPGNADAWNARGDMLNALGRYPEALAAYDEALAIRPDIPLVLANRGRMLNALGRYADASACIDRAVTLQPDLADAWEVYGEIFWNQAEYPEALAMFERALALKPDHADAKVYREMIRNVLNRAAPEDTPAVDSEDSRYIPAEIKGAVWERDGGRCVICGSWRHLEYDHRVPFSKGGDNTEHNIRILCRKCKKRKPGKTESEME